MKINYLIIAMLACGFDAFSMELPAKKQKVETAKATSIAYYLINQPQLIQQRRKGKILDLSNLNLTSLTGLELLPDRTTIEELNLSDNNLTRIENNAFAGMNNITTIDLSHNQITTLDPLAFKGLPKLIKIDLDNNKLKRIDIAFAHLHSLEHLYLEENDIAYIAPNAFRDLKNLKKLWLGHNKLTTIEPTALIDRENSHGLLRATMINLEDNPLADQKGEREKINELMGDTLVVY